MHIVGGVRWADITDGTDEVVSDIADAPLVAVDLVFAADGVVGVEPTKSLYRIGLWI